MRVEAKEELIAELKRNGIKHSPERIIEIDRDLSGRVVFLETGRPGHRGAGLTHILERHKDEFAIIGIAEEDLPAFIIAVATKGQRVGVQGTRPVYRVEFRGKAYFAAVDIGSNGFIVGANPTSQSAWLSGQSNEQKANQDSA